MIDKLTVIATNNGRDNLAHLVQTENRRPVCVVDTGSSDPTHEEWLKTVERLPNVVVLRTPYRGYDTGAYLWAYYNLPAKHYLFIQDSMQPRVPDYIEQMHAYLPDDPGVVAWSNFRMDIWDSAPQRTTINYMFGVHDEALSWPKKGIFGPNFYCTRSALDRLLERGILPSHPLHKEMAQGMERGWAIAFHRAGVPVTAVVDEPMPRGYAMQEGTYPIFTKLFKGRA